MSFACRTCENKIGAIDVITLRHLEYNENGILRGETRHFSAGVGKRDVEKLLDKVDFADRDSILSHFIFPDGTLARTGVLYLHGDCANKGKRTYAFRAFFTKIRLCSKCKGVRCK